MAKKNGVGLIKTKIGNNEVYKWETPSDYTKPIIPTLNVTTKSPSLELDENGFLSGIRAQDAFDAYNLTNRNAWVKEKGNLNPNERVAALYDPYEAFFRLYPNGPLHVDDYSTGESRIVTAKNRDQLSTNPMQRAWYKIKNNRDTYYNHAFNPANEDPYGLLERPTVLPRYNLGKGLDVNRVIANGQYVDSILNDFSGFVENSSKMYRENPKTKEKEEYKEYDELGNVIPNGYLRGYYYKGIDGMPIFDRKKLKSDSENLKRLVEVYGNDLEAILNKATEDNLLSQNAYDIISEVVGTYNPEKPIDKVSMNRLKMDNLRRHMNAVRAANEYRHKYYTEDSNKSTTNPVFGTLDLNSSDYEQQRRMYEAQDAARDFRIRPQAAQYVTTTKARGGSMPTQQKKPTKPSPEWIKNQYGMMAHIAPGYSNDEWDVYI